ncbi:hypothetical protein [Sanguibacter inulinus]|uniref:DUF5667 domain-containing protein n=1 Tax=Sanguibacter inulinus TaxID=60922 RepID=A0A853F007_9MICO|nr:hypothetical protein [Sanguibacter inulinus]MBF0724017.1 hypothetical protein [Sanguibacter inulinus]NYS95162.1 hypothetical protein [Sanguibacter inulinus]
MTPRSPVSTTGPDVSGVTPVADEAAGPDLPVAPRLPDETGGLALPDRAEGSALPAVRALPDGGCALDLPASRSLPVEPDDAAVPGAPGETDGPGQVPEGAPSLVRRRRRVVVAAASAAVVMVLVGIFVYRAWDAGVESDLAEATEALHTVVLELHSAVDTSETVLASSDGRVADDQVRVDLAAVASGVDELSWSLPRGSRQARTVAATGLAEQARTYVSAVETATGLVLVAVDAFELEQATRLEGEATERLALSIADGRATLDATAGQVLDDAVRVTLSDALASAEALEPALGDETLSAVEQMRIRAAAAADLTLHADALDAARQGVVDAQVAWQAEQDRVAAEQAAQAAQAAEEARRAQEQATTRPDTSGRSSNTGGPAQVRPKISGGTEAPATGGGPSVPAPSAPAPESAYETETETGTWCGTGDTSGAEGTGGWC